MKTLLLAPQLLKLDRIVSQAGSITLFVRSIQAQALCPDCQQPAVRTHSRYERTLADLPWEGVAVKIKLQTRRFFCDQVECPRQIFCERLPALAARYARNTTRLYETLWLFGLLVGGEAGAQIAVGYARRNGQTEGQVNRLKNLKRQMYGRAKFDLLKLRVLASS